MKTTWKVSFVDTDGKEQPHIFKGTLNIKESELVSGLNNIIELARNSEGDFRITQIEKVEE